MQALVDYLTNLIGIDADTFWRQFTTNNSYNTYQWDYGAMIQYVCCTLIIICVIRSVFAFLRAMFFKK